MGTKYQRPGGSYAGQAALGNRTKYQDDATATPKRAISSGKMDGDFNYLIDAVNETWDALAGAGFAAALPNQAGNAGKVPVTNGTATSWQLVGNASVQDQSLALTKLANVGAAKVLGADSSGAVAALGVGSGLAVNGGALTLTAPLPPTGMVTAFAGVNAPVGWLLCFGQAVSRSTYPALFGVLGTTYGSGDGSTTFTLPDLRGRAVFGLDSMGGAAAARVTATSGMAATVLGAAGGDERLHAHGHGVTDAGHAHKLFTANTVAVNTSGPTAAQTVAYQGSTSSFTSNYCMSPDGTTAPTLGLSGSATSGVTVNSAGAGGSQNMPPFLTLNFIVKT